MTTRRQLLLVVAGLVAFPALSACGSSSSGKNGDTLTVDEFADRVGQDGVVVLDVRTPQEFAEGHLPGAKVIDIEAADFAGKIDALDKSAKHAVYCRTGRRSAAAIDHMVQAGFTDVAHLEGGITAWQGAGKPVTQS
ncbi:rhodanese-like domain-containing protein [Luteococcus sp. H138]|uniref:rhodanese-like domain-containing protein n=1 Tax=unclassified Luteococcus TaxID=2639923 RepID=UPI00313F173C